MGQHVRLRQTTGKRVSPISLGGGKDSESQPSRVLTIGYVYRSQQNGAVYDPTGVAPCLCAGAHSGVEPRIIVYD